MLYAGDVARTRVYGDEVCERLGIERSTLSAYVSRGQFAPPVGYTRKGSRGRPKSWWWSTTIEAEESRRAAKVAG